MEDVLMILKDMSDQELLDYKNVLLNKISRYQNLQLTKKVCL